MYERALKYASVGEGVSLNSANASSEPPPGRSPHKLVVTSARAA